MKDIWAMGFIELVLGAGTVFATIGLNKIILKEKKEKH